MFNMDLLRFIYIYYKIDYSYKYEYLELYVYNSDVSYKVKKWKYINCTERTLKFNHPKDSLLWFVRLPILDDMIETNQDKNHKNKFKNESKKVVKHRLKNRSRPKSRYNR